MLWYMRIAIPGFARNSPLAKRGCATNTLARRSTRKVKSDSSRGRVLKQRFDYPSILTNPLLPAVANREFACRANSILAPRAILIHLEKGLGKIRLQSRS